MTSVPPAHPPAAPETDVNALREALAKAVGRELGCVRKGLLDGHQMCGEHHYGWLSTGECPTQERVTDAVLSVARERVRVVEGERDAARREERMRAEDHANAWREVAIVTARAESAEAAHRALQAIAEDIAYQHAATIDGEYGCCHDEDALRAGGRVPEFDGDEFEPIPDDCPGKQTLDRHLARIAREGR